MKKAWTAGLAICLGIVFGGVYSCLAGETSRMVPCRKASLEVPFVKVLSSQKDAQQTGEEYRLYRNRFYGIQHTEELEEAGFSVIEEHIFPIDTKAYGAVSLIPAMDQTYHRLALFLADQEGDILYRTDQLEVNNRYKGELKQPVEGLAAVSFQDLNEDGLLDILLITFCKNETGELAKRPYKVGDVLFQDEKGFYRDWRLSDRINRFGMNKSIGFLVSFVKGGYSTEFLYTASSLDELKKQGFQVFSQQTGLKEFEKQGQLILVPGLYHMAEYNVFMLYLVNSHGNIVWSFQPMGDYESLYSLEEIQCLDIDGDGLQDIVILAKYSYEGEHEEIVTAMDYSVYYQRTNGFYEDTEIKKQVLCNGGETMEELAEQLRAYWGWK